MSGERRWRVTLGLFLVALTVTVILFSFVDVSHFETVFLSAAMVSSSFVSSTVSGGVILLMYWPVLLSENDVTAPVGSVADFTTPSL